MHPRLQKLPISTALAALLESSMERKHGEVYARAEALYNMAKDTGNTPDPQFPIVLSEMVQTFTGVYRCMSVVWQRLMLCSCRIIPGENIQVVVQGVHCSTTGACSDLSGVGFGSSPCGFVCIVFPPFE